MNQKMRFTVTLLMIVMILGFYVLKTGKDVSWLDFPASLSEVAAVVDGEELTLEELAFYIAYRENQVEKDAMVYNPEDTSEYWKVYSNGTFIRSEAKQSVLDMAVHDEIFYQLSIENGLTLDAEEEAFLANTQYDFWSDLSEEQRDALGVGQEILNESIRKAALAEKYQNLLAEINETGEEAYAFSGSAYQKLAEEHQCEIKEDVWKRVNFGNITVGHMGYQSK